MLLIVANCCKVDRQPVARNEKSQNLKTPKWSLELSQLLQNFLKKRSYFEILIINFYKKEKVSFIVYLIKGYLKKLQLLLIVANCCKVDRQPVARNEKISKFKNPEMVSRVVAIVAKFFEKTQLL